MMFDLLVGDKKPFEEKMIENKKTYGENDGRMYQNITSCFK